MTPSTNILLCTLGASWPVIPEIFAWLAPGQLDLYRHHRDARALDAARHEHALQPPDELWICTTGGEQTAKSLQHLDTWWHALAAPIPMRIWIAEGTDALSTAAECRQLREMILRVALLASERTGRSGQLVVSLAGGRKTMSADLQEAAGIFGAHAFLHVVGPDPMPSALKVPAPNTFLEALPAKLAEAINPLVVGEGQRSELLDIPLNGRIVNTQHFPCRLAEDRKPYRWTDADKGVALDAELRRRRAESQRLLGNFVVGITRQEQYENWRSLYRLPAARIEQLRKTLLAPEHRGLLEALPKADLHRHIGGCLDVGGQREVARSIIEASDADERARAETLVRPLLKQQTMPWPLDWPERLKGPQRAAACAMLLLQADDAQLERNLFAVTEPRLALKERHPLGFAAYERPGELTGSAQLCHPAAIAPYANALVRQARREGIHYLELRGSPQKYRAENPAAFVAELEAALRAAGARTCSAQDAGEDDAAPRIGFIWILDRRGGRSISETISTAVQARQHFREFLLGLDLAGDEGSLHPEVLAEDFLPVFEACMPVTIHAGEGEKADNIWQAAYHLHADRIGHGLSLVDNPELMQRFRNRDIALEICPTSNREVVGFRDPLIQESAKFSPHPLGAMLKSGLPVSICTDNPGISRTTLAEEYLAASRMTEVLSIWDALALVRQGFRHAMAPARERDARLRALESTVLQCMLEHAPE